MSDYGSVTDPVKMYLREMGLVTLLSREGEVEIAKKIEAGEQDVLKALLETTFGIDYLLDLGQRIENQTLRPKHVLRDIDEGDTYQDELVQIDAFIKIIKAITDIHAENMLFREQLFNNQKLAPRHAEHIGYLKSSGGSAAASPVAIKKFSTCSRSGDWKAASSTR